jgi:hypothetical protein
MCVTSQKSAYCHSSHVPICVLPVRSQPIVTFNTFQYVSYQSEISLLSLLTRSNMFLSPYLISSVNFLLLFSFNCFGTFSRTPFPFYTYYVPHFFLLVAFVACSLRHFRFLHCQQLLSAPLSLNQILPFICTFSRCLISLRYSSAIHHSLADAANFQFYYFVKAMKMPSVRVPLQ